MKNFFLLVLTGFIAWWFGTALVSFAPLFFYKPVFLFALVVGMALLTVLLTRPKFCIVLLILLRSSIEPLLGETQLPFFGRSLGFGAVLNLLVVVLALVELAKRPVGWRDVPLRKQWIFFLATSLIGVTFSPDRTVAGKLFGDVLSYFAMFTFPFLLIRTAKDLQFWLRVLVLSFVLPILLSFTDLCVGGHLFSGQSSRINGVFTHPNILAFYLILCLAGLVYLMKRAVSERMIFSKQWSQLLIVFCLILLASTGTRNAWIALWGMMFLYGLLQDKKYTLICFLVIPLVMVVPSVRERAVDIFTKTDRTLEQGMNSWEWRVALWKFSFESIRRAPILGHGLGSFKVMSADFFPGRQEWGAHNTYLQVLFEGGVIGLLSFCALLWALWKRLLDGWTKTRVAKYAVALVYLVSYAVICIADNLLYYLVLNWYVFFFLALVIRDIQMREWVAVSGAAGAVGRREV